MPNNGNRQHRRPRWSVKSSFLTAVALLVAVTIIVFLTVHKSVWTELEVVTTGVALLMFVYASVVLYLGVRFDKNERFVIARPQFTPAMAFDASTVLADATDATGAFLTWGMEAGPLGCILGILLNVIGSLVLAILISFLLWLGVNALWAASLAVFLPLFYFYRRFLRLVVIKGRSCHRHWGRSVGQASWTTLQYAVWFYLIFVLAHHLGRIIPR